MRENWPSIFLCPCCWPVIQFFFFFCWKPDLPQDSFSSLKLKVATQFLIPEECGLTVPQPDRMERIIFSFFNYKPKKNWDGASICEKCPRLVTWLNWASKLSRLSETDLLDIKIPSFFLPDLLNSIRIASVKSSSKNKVPHFLFNRLIAERIIWSDKMLPLQVTTWSTATFF